jgi:hypothetical protein
LAAGFALRGKLCHFLRDGFGIIEYGLGILPEE